MKKSIKFLTFISVTLLLITSIAGCNNKAEEATETVAESTFNLATTKAEGLKSLAI